jgi:hypothetical protein
MEDIKGEDEDSTDYTQDSKSLDNVSFLFSTVIRSFRFKGLKYLWQDVKGCRVSRYITHIIIILFIVVCSVDIC